MKPSVGRIVHFVSEGGAHYAAIVTRVYGDEVVNLFVMPGDGSQAFAFTSALMDAAGEAQNSWHWPERE